jgi:hypothetical protein
MDGRAPAMAYGEQIARRHGLTVRAGYGDAAGPSRITPRT